ncbi:MAG: SagB/ThcOx family dehydrogenase [Gammaproteobacteria bacterium]|nr:SagB/ThcOx family dehydrogenase [Gammaproteobacteria bacterium]
MEKVFAYHDATKHHYHAYAPGPGFLDWATQPDPFRRYAGADILPLDHFSQADGPPYELALTEGSVALAPLTRETVSRLFYDSLALSAWKQAGQSRWALRVNPSSGNLHPTEAYLIGGPVPGLLEAPVVCHYTPRIHALEVRTRFALDAWRDLVTDLPPQSLIIGLSSVYWREAWKYGSRAFRYCQHDVGHAIAAIGFAAAALGWKAALLDDLGDEAIAGLLGLSHAHGPEAERPECLLAVYPQTLDSRVCTLPRAAIEAIAQGEWNGTPNILSPDHRSWPIIDEVDAATRKDDGAAPYSVIASTDSVEVTGDATILLRQLAHRRRSAVAMDGKTELSRAAFYSILQRCLPGVRRFPFNALPWPPTTHLLLFVHRVQDVPPGLYILMRDRSKIEELKAALGREFDWARPEGCPVTLTLYRLAAGNCRRLAERVSCHQEIAADGAFAVAMLAEFERQLAAYGPWFYRRLYWECGILGQLLYLEAEAHGLQATGIGCFFDDPVHEVLGLRDRRYQSLYHFTLGGGVEDVRLTTHPPYPGPARPT